MKICLVTPYDLAVPGGVTKHALSLAAALRAGGDDVEVIGPAGGRVRLGPHVTGFGGVVSIQANHSDNRIGLLTSPAAVRRFMRARRFDVVHVHEPLLIAISYYAVWTADARARVCTFHRYTEREGALTRTVRRALAFHLRRFEAGIAVSEAAAEYARVAWNRPLAIVPNGVDAAFFAQSPDRPIAPSPDSLSLLFVAQWSDRRKGLAVLLEALARLRARGVAASLDVIGRGIGAPPQASGVTFHGAVSEEELRARLHACDLLVAPSLGCESFGMVLIEGMAAGRPIVCSDIEGYRRVAPADGSVLVPPGDADALAAALERLARDRDRRHAMGAANLVHAQQYDWSVVARRIRLEYEAALEPIRDACIGSCAPAS